LIVVTGGAGFIGSSLIWSLNKRDLKDILVVDSLGNDEKWKNLNGLSFSDYLEKESFLDRITQGGPLPDIDTIIHMGACSDTTEKDCSYLIRNNYEYTKELAIYAIRNDIRFIYASSAATYGDGSLGFVDNEDKLESFMPLNMYGYSKHIFDLWAKSQGLLDKIAGIKYFNVFGPNEYHKGDMRSFVLKGFKQVKDTGSLLLFKSYKKEFAHDEQKRDFIYVKDAAKMTLFFFDHPEINGIFNVGTGSPRTWNDLANAIFKAMGADPHIEYIDMPSDLKDKYQYFTQADTSKIIAAGYTIPATSMEDAVKEYVTRYLMQGYGYL